MKIPLMSLEPTTLNPLMKRVRGCPATPCHKEKCFSLGQRGLQAIPCQKGNKLHALSQRDLQAIWEKPSPFWPKGFACVLLDKRKNVSPSSLQKQGYAWKNRSLLLISQLISVFNLRLFLIDFAFESLIETCTLKNQYIILKKRPLQ